MENLYEILQVSEKASSEIIEKAYKTLAKTYHPDIAKDKKAAEEMMKKINHAYDILSDATKRSEYDQEIQAQKERENATQKSYTNYANTNANISVNRNMNANQTQTRNTSYYSDFSDLSNMNIVVLIKKFLKLKTKHKLIVLGGIIVAIGIIIFTLGYLLNSLFGYNNNVNNKPSNEEYLTSGEEYINDDMPKKITIEFLNALKEFDVHKMKQYVKNTEIFDSEEIKNIQNNASKLNKYREVYKSFEVNIAEIKVTTKKAIVTFDVKRRNVENAILQYNISLLYYGSELEEKDKRDIFNDALNNYAQKSIITTGEFNFEKVNGEWKILLNDSNFADILGCTFEHISLLF